MCMGGGGGGGGGGGHIISSSNFISFLKTPLRSQDTVQTVLAFHLRSISVLSNPSPPLLYTGCYRDK